MPYYIVKVKDDAGFLLPPLVAHCASESEALQAVRSMVGEIANVEIRGKCTDLMTAAFGQTPKGTVNFREDWTWDADRPKPY